MISCVAAIGKNDASDSQAILDRLAAQGGGICIIASDAQKGPIFASVPQNVVVVDFRYGGKPSILSGNHPRKEGIWTQYSNLGTGLSRNVVVSDSISNATPIEDWRSEPHTMQDAPHGVALSSEEYRHAHNHYQNFLSELYNFSDTLNGVAIWGDSGAFVPGAKSWGGFFSARSWPLKWADYKPSGSPEFEDNDFDAALIGVEVDVLNAGKDWGEVAPGLEKSMAKVGVQIVGFGSRNTAAVEIRTEDTDDPLASPESRRGAWKWGIIMRNALHEQSTVLHCENGRIARGIDLSLSTFTDGAMLITGAGRKSGIIFDLGGSGEVYSDGEGLLTVRGGAKGVSLETESGDYLRLEKDGTVSMSPTVRQSLRQALFSESSHGTPPSEAPASGR